MKKITLMLLCSFTLISQEFDSGVVALTTNISARVQTNATTVTLTVSGPSDRWFAMGFGVNEGNAMSSGGDCLVFTDTGISDRTFVGFMAPSIDATNSWTLVSNTVNGGVRTIVGTRNLSSSGNYTFVNSNNTIPVVWARSSSASYALANHGSTNRGGSSINTTLGNEQFNIKNFRVYPNPVSDNQLKISLPETISQAEYAIYEITGKLLQRGIVSNINNAITLNRINAGSYLINLIDEFGNSSSKTFLVQ